MQIKNKMKIKKLSKKRKIVVGVTGSFGTGKSTVAALLRKNGFVVFDADRIAHETLQATNPVFAKICEKFPGAVSHGFLDREKLANIVFKSKQQLKRLERLIHPYVLKRMIAETKKTKKKHVVLEVPLLFEAGFQKICDLVVTVFADIAESEKRLVHQGWTRSEIRRRRAAQWPMRKKMQRADFVINNSGVKAKTQQQVRSFLKTINQSTTKK